MERLKLNSETFGPLMPFVEEKDITDIRWDGSNLWIDDLKKGKSIVDIKLNEQFIDRFTQRIADSVNTSYNPSSPVLEGETDKLRIACLHPSKTNTGTAITIRKTEPECRMTEKSIIDDGYCSQDILNLLISLVRSRASILVTGDTGSGKTELIKFLIQYIPDSVTTLTVEDNYELRAKALRPKFDCTEIKVDERFTPRDAIKAGLRQNTKWMILSEARSKEALNLLEAASTGCSAMTTVHSFDVRNIPERFESMIGENNVGIKNKVCTHFDVGILIVKQETPLGIIRKLQQLCFFEHTPKGNVIHMVVENGVMNDDFNIPQKLLTKYNLYQVDVPRLNIGVDKSA